MKKNDWVRVFLLLSLYLLVLFIFKRDIFYFKFDNKLIDRYFLSQDITHEVPGKRLFLSDGDIYLSTGYLYVNGADPSEYNFEHPPVIKYLFGLSIYLFNNPYVVQVILGGLLLTTFYFITKNITKKSTIAFIACLFLIFDPLFLDLSAQPLLDLGQTLFMLLYFVSIFYLRENFILQGLLLALFAGSKFWITPIFFVTTFYGYKIYIKQFNWKYFFLQLLSAFIFYSLFYTQTFILKSGHFNIIWHILKTFKYRVDHNTSSIFGASLILFLTGYFKSWWGRGEIIRILTWSLMWPIGLLSTLIRSLIGLKKGLISLNLLVTVIPIVYLLYLGVQAPFPRYFMIILPFIYLVLAENIFALYKKIDKHKSIAA